MSIDRTAALVVGVDFGTLSGRAVVVRVHDGAELGSAVTDYPHARTRLDGCPAAAGSLPPDWALQVPADYVEVLRTAVPAALAARRRRPGAGDRHRHRLHGLHDGPDHGRRHPAVRARRVRRRAARLRQAVAAPRRAAAGRPDQRAGREAPGAVAAPLRRPDLLGVGVREGPAGPAGGPGGLRGDAALGRGRRLDRLAADRPVRAQRLHRRLQGHPAGRRLPVAGLLPRARPRVRATSSPTSWSIRSASSATAPAACPRGPRSGPGCRRASRSRSATSTRTSPRPPRRPVEPGHLVAIMGTSTCHVMNGDAAARGARACAAWSTAGSAAGYWGYEAGQSGVGDIFGWFVEHGVPAELPRHRPRTRHLGARAAHRAGRRAGRRRSTG